MTLPTMTLREMRDAAQQRADLVGSGFVTDAEWNANLHGSMFELYDMLVAAQPVGYYATLPPYSFTTDGTSDRYALPSDFYKLQGVDVLVGAAPNYVTLKPYNFAERNRYAGVNGLPTSLGRASALRYRLIGNYLQLSPRAASGQTVQVWYVPKLSPLVETIVLTFDGVATDDAITIGGYSIPVGYSWNGAALAVAPFTTDYGAAAVFAALVGSLVGTAGAYAVLSVTGLASGTGESVTVTLSVATGAVSQAVVSQAASIVVSSTPLVAGTTTFDGFSGWLDYAILDAAIKALVKQEKDASALMAQKAAMKDRIARMAENRDVGEPSVSVDVNATGGFDWCH